ncbi:MAG: hypothetical protein AB7O98_10175 [Hyphomonadaceae bacterium]
MITDRRRLVAGAAGALAAPVFPLDASATPPRATEAVRRERMLAAAERKGVLLSFFASWCAWCRPMDTLLQDAAMMRVIGSRYRILHVRALERSDTRRAEQMPGAEDLMLEFAHPSAGLPFLAFLAPDGRALATSFSAINHENIGFPVGEENLDAFDAMIARAAPGVSGSDRAAIRAACTRIARP